MTPQNYIRLVPPADYAERQRFLEAYEDEPSYDPAPPRASEGWFLAAGAIVALGLVTGFFLAGLLL